jgi:hypothetical protein
LFIDDKISFGHSNIYFRLKEVIGLLDIIIDEGSKFAIVVFIGGTVLMMQRDVGANLTFTIFLGILF